MLLAFSSWEENNVSIHLNKLCQSPKTEANPVSPNPNDFCVQVAETPKIVQQPLNNQEADGNGGGILAEVEVV